MVAARQDGAVRRHEGTRRAEREERVRQGLLLAPELCQAGSTVTLPGTAHLSSGVWQGTGGSAGQGKATSRDQGSVGRRWHRGLVARGRWWDPRAPGWVAAGAGPCPTWG